jgi:hypothetical protein
MIPSRAGMAIFAKSNGWPIGAALSGTTKKENNPALVSRQAETSRPETDNPARASRGGR